LPTKPIKAPSPGKLLTKLLAHHLNITHQEWQEAKPSPQEPTELELTTYTLQEDQSKPALTPAVDMPNHWALEGM
jgi:hypothetical protein